jgi:hypothetical protein
LQTGNTDFQVKKIAAFILTMAFAVQTFNFSFIVFEFYANQKYIAARLCENRDKPLLHCDGKCQLAKKIKSEQNKNRQNPERKTESKNETLSSKSFFATTIPTIQTSHPDWFIFNDGMLAGERSYIFHPPSAL